MERTQVMRSETLRHQHEQASMREKVRENAEKIKQNKVLPYLVANVVEVSYIGDLSGEVLLTTGI